MKKVFDEVNSLDKKCYDRYALSEDILMEHAATSMLDFCEQNFKKDSKILIACGVGNNGADGITLARLLQSKYNITLFLPFSVNSVMAKLQLKRANKVDVKIINHYSSFDTKYALVVDCLFGSGLKRDLDKQYQKIIKKLNKINAYKLSCDIPSGINNLGQISSVAFKSDTTITMGALKKSLFTDIVKDYVGDIKVANLGVQRKLYEGDTNCYLLNKKDLKLPFRDIKSTHKGSFGHLSVIIGDKKGAGLLCAQAGFAFGCGLITAVNTIKEEIKKIPNHIMQSKTIPQNTTALCIGMGLGDKYDKSYFKNNIPKVIDADLFYDKIILDILQQDNIVLTPHPKEFCSLLKLTNIADIDINKLQNNRFKYLSMFSKKYPKITILLKGANVLIAQNKKLYINRFGTSALSKGGSGDVLSGLIGSLLAQGYSTLEATINGSLAHTIAALKYSGNNYSLTPKELINQIKKL